MKNVSKLLVALNFPSKKGTSPIDQVVGNNIFTDICGDEQKEDSVYMSPNSYKDIFGKTRKESSRCSKRISVVRIYSKKTRKAIHRKYVCSSAFIGLGDKALALHPSSIRELCGPGFENDDIVGGEVKVSRGSWFLYFWNHPFHATRISMKLGVFSIIIALISIALSI